MKFKKTIAGIVIVFGAASLPVVPVPDGYYVRQAPSSKAQFTKVERTADLKGLTEAHIIGSACYDQFTAPLNTLEPIRRRIDCTEYWNRANIPDYPTPTSRGDKELDGGRVWSSYVTHLFDTPSGDLEEGYYAKSDDIVSISAAQAALEGLTPKAEAAISLDAVSDQTADSTSVTSLSWSHTITASASTTVLIIGIAMTDSNDAERTVNSITFNADSAFLIREDDEVADNTSDSLWQLPDPDLGAKTITATLAGSNTDADGGALSIHGVDHYTPVDAQASSAAVGGDVTGQVTTVADNSWVFVVGSTITYTAANADYTLSAPGVQIGKYEGASGPTLMTSYFGPQVSAGAASTTWVCVGSSCATNDWISSQASFDPNCNSAGDICSQLFRASTSWTAPVNLTSVDAACWGGGGGGGTVSGNGGGGGGGGAFASSTVSVTAGNSYAIVVGTGGAIDTAGGSRDSTFNSTSVVADGGLGTSSGSAGAGGTTAGSTGTVKAAGGNGGTGASFDGGGGGGGAGGQNGAGAVGSNGGASGGTGGTGNNTLGGAGGTQGLRGGTSLLGGGGGGGGSTGPGAGGAGGVIGAGGGGGGSGAAGAAGANGACLLVWTYPAAGAASTYVSNPKALIQSAVQFFGQTFFQ